MQRYNKYRVSFKKLRLLMWKDFLLQYRDPFQVLVEIIFPTAFSVMLVIIRYSDAPVEYSKTNYTEFDLLSFLSADLLQQRSLNDTSLLLYSPNSVEIASIMSCFKWFYKIKGFASEKDLVKYYMTTVDQTIVAALNFNSRKLNNPNLEIKISIPIEWKGDGIKLGWHTNQIYPTLQMPGPRDFKDNYGASPTYYKEGFLTIQYVTALLIINQNIARTKCLKTLQTTNEVTNKERLLEIIDVNITMKRFPYTKWKADSLLQSLLHLGSLLIMISLSWVCSNMVWSITAEKEFKLKESMKIMGLPNYLHWMAWFLKSFAHLLISVSIIVILLKVTWYSNMAVLANSSSMVILTFFLLYIISAITFSFAMTVFFSNANIASTVASAVWYMSYTPYVLMQDNYDSISMGLKLFTSLSANTAMAHGFQIILRAEGNGQGVQWNNIFCRLSQENKNNLTLSMVMGMLLLDTFIYLFIALYVEAVLPGESGIAQPWYFLFTRKYWRGEFENIQFNTRRKGIQPVNQEIKFYEEEPANVLPTIQIRGLTKTFKKKTAINNLNLNLYEGEITVLIGHNGAGKTVTIHTLTGMLRPTKGTAIINGYDIRTNMNEVRKSMGLCLHHDIIFNELSVEEHLYFCSKLKGTSGSKLKREINKYVQMLDLEPKRHAIARTLTEGLKRRLSIGMALCADSKIVMLDEPTSGMDPSGRRILWEALQSEKEDRTILMTTHLMDEADMLGDRIAILAGGELQSYGTSYYLKKTFGGGYHLIMDKSEYCAPHAVTNLLQKHIPSIEVTSDIGSQLIYFLKEEHSSVYEQLLRDLENNYQDLGIRSFGIRLTTLEDVFMKIGTDHDKRESYSEVLEEVNRELFIQNISEIGNRRSRRKSMYGQRSTIKKSGHKALLYQVYSIILKRILFLIRNWFTELLQIIIPIIFLVIAFATIRDESKVDHLHKMPLTLDTFVDPNTLMEGHNRYFPSYAKLARKVVVVDNLEKAMIDMRQRQPMIARKSYIIGAVFKKQADGRDKIIAYFNNDAFHSPAIALGYALNAVSQYKNGQEFIFVNQPLPYRLSSKVFSLATDSVPEFTIAFNVSYSLTIVLSLYVLFYVEERASKYKHLQYMSGVKIYIFWTISYIIDLLTFVLTTIILLVALSFYKQEGFTTFVDLCRIFFIFFSFGFCAMPMNYIVSLLTKDPPLGYTIISTFGTSTGSTAFTVIAVLKELNWGAFSHNVHLMLLRFSPYYSLVVSLKNNYKMHGFNKLCYEILQICVDNNHTKAECQRKIKSNFYTRYCNEAGEHNFSWEEPGIGKNLFVFFLLGIILFGIMILQEYNIFCIFFTNIWKKIYKKKVKEKKQWTIAGEIDDDVREEKMKIHHTPPEDLFEESTLILKDVTKYYKQFLAVNSLCLAVDKYECFGLLGTNGAGKTTVFKMLTGDLPMTSGDAWVGKFRLRTRFEQVQELIGYCPQHDALLNDLTPRETLIMFGLVRGFRYSTSKALTIKLSIDFDFYRMLDRKIKELSRGYKRKISTAIALIADPLVIFLDEPTTGMDVSTKRYLWNVLNEVREHGKCIVFTSHNMEECEALCTRIAIMVNGEFKCLGSSQHLKYKFAAGYSLIIKIKKQKHQYLDLQEIDEFVQKKFLDAQLKERQGEVLTFYINNTELKLSEMFGILEVEKQKKNTKIEDYSLGQTSLEQIFLTLTQFQKPRFSKYRGRIII